jgi:hypothetical protein
VAMKDGNRPERAHFLRAPSPETKIWRYMDFTKFVFMLEERALFFSRADHLLDPFEGRASETSLKSDEALEPSLSRSDGAAGSGSGARQRFFINSWHVNEHESIAMWKLFAKSDDAIAVESTYGRLRACLPANVGAEGEPRGAHIDAALVEYVDPEHSEKLPFDFCEFLRKRRSSSMSGNCVPSSTSPGVRERRARWIWQRKPAGWWTSTWNVSWSGSTSALGLRRGTADWSSASCADSGSRPM